MKQIIDVITEGGNNLAERNADWQREMAASREPDIGIQAFSLSKPRNSSGRDALPGSPSSRRVPDSAGAAQ